MDEEILQPEPNEVGPGAGAGGAGAFSDPGVAELFSLLVQNQAAQQAAVPTEQELAMQEAELRKAAEPDIVGTLLGALLPAAIGAAVDGKRGALIASGGASKQLLQEANETEKMLNKKLEEARKRRDKKAEIADKGRTDIIKLGLTETLKDKREAFRATTKLQAARLNKSNFEINMPDKEKSQLAAGKTALEGLKGTMDLVSDSKYGSNWLDVIFAESFDPKSVEAQVKSELESLAISMAGLKQAGVLTEKDVAPFRSLAGLRSFKTKESLLQNLTRLYNRSVQDIKSLGANYTDVHNNPNQFFQELSELQPITLDQQGVGSQPLTATNPKTGEVVVYNPQTGKWE